MAFVCGYCSKINSNYSDLEDHLDTCDEEEVFDIEPQDISEIPYSECAFAKFRKMLKKEEKFKKATQKLIQQKPKKKVETDNSELPYSESILAKFRKMLKEKEELRKAKQNQKELKTKKSIEKDDSEIPYPESTFAKSRKMLTVKDLEKEKLKQSKQWVMEMKTKKRIKRMAAGLPDIKFEVRMKLVDNSKGLLQKKPHYVCAMCEFETTTMVDAKSHFVNNHKYGKYNRLYNCRFCLRNFKLKLDLTRHEATEHQSEMFQLYNCRFCLRNFKLKLDLTKHEATEHQSEMFQYKCSICEKGFVNKKRAQKHENHHFQRIKKNFPELSKKSQVVKAYQENPKKFLGFEPIRSKILKPMPSIKEN